MRVCVLVLALLAAARPAGAEDALPVEILTAAATPQTIDYQLAGTIEAPDVVVAGFRDGGRILSVAVNVGDRVAKGQELARVDPAQAQAARDAAEAALTGAEAALTEAQASYDRVTARLASGVATRAELDSATQALATTRASRDQARAQLSKARRAVEDCVLRAPQDAIVTTRAAEPGQVVGPGATVVILASDSRRQAVFYAPDSVDLDAFLGQRLQLSLIDRPETTLTARLSEVSPVVDAATGTVRVKADIATLPPGDPLLGTPVLGHLALTLPPAIRLPWDALTATARGPAVWTVDPASHAVALTPVTISAYGEDTITLAAGLAPGQQVVGAGSQLLYPGRIVTKAAP
jgi:RND family efflux transporter MFP subunit